MSGSDQKGPSFLDPPPIHRLHHDLHCRAPELVGNSSNHIDPGGTPPKLPLKLPHRRKFFTLSMYNSTDSDVDSSRNSPALDTEIAWNRSSAHKQYQESLDLRTIAAGSCKLGMAMEGSCLAGEEQILEKKKLLAQLTGMNPDAGKSKAFYESMKGFRESLVMPQSNPCRVCRFCGREFPSGRALGGHMRVHGALLDAQLSNMQQEKKIQNEGKQQYAEKKKHEEKLGSIAPNCVASGTTYVLSPSKDCNNREQSTDADNDEYKEEAGSLCEKLDADICTTPTTTELKQEERGDHLFHVSYSLEHSASNGLPSNMDSTHILGIESVPKMNSTLYELRRNPKPSQRFMNKEEHHVAQITHPFNLNCHSTQSALELPSSTTAEDMQQSHSPESADPCSECGKVFPSWKALFGHMRCHPEREWRGIQRPDGSGELDRMARMIARRPSMEGSTELDLDQPHQYKNNCMKVEITEEIAHTNAMDSKELRANQHKSKCMDIKEIMDSSAEEKGASLANGEARVPGKLVQEVPTNDLDLAIGRHNEGEEANRNIQSSNHKLQESRICSHVDEMIDDWTPSWSAAGKRSRRASKKRRVSYTHTQPALTSDQTTASDEIKIDQREYDAGDYMEDLVDPANCLVMLSKSMPEVKKSTSTEESALSHPSKVWQEIANVDQLERAWDDAVRNRMHEHDDFEAEDYNDDDDDDDEDDNGDGDDGDDQAEDNGGHIVPATLSVKYQCSTCKKCFNSHQALGGHRASHRKMKGCFARMKSLAAYDVLQESSEEINTNELEYSKEGKIMKASPQEEKGSVRRDLTDKSPKKKFKGHECSICHRIFVTGQALGGHKRCHWTGEKAPGVSDAASVASSSTENRQQTGNIQEREEWGCRSKSKAKEDVFDLNLPAPVDEDDEVDLAAACAGAPMNSKLRPPMWKQQEWYPTKVAHIPQVCSVKTL